MRLGRRKTTALLLLGVVAATAIVYILWHQEKPKYEILYAANQEIFLKKVDSDSDSEESYARFNISEDTILKDSKGDVLAFHDLEIGQVVIVYSDEQSFVLLSDPPILGAKEIIVLR